MGILKTTSKKVLRGHINKLNITSGLLSALIAVLALVLMSGFGIKLMLEYMAKDAFSSSGSVVLAPAGKVLYSPQLVYVVFGIFLISAVLSILLSGSLRARYEKTLNASISGFRWLLVGVNGALLLALTSILAGVNNIMTLKLICSMVLVTAVFGWLSDRENARDKNPHMLAYYVSIVTAIVAFLPLLGTIFGTWYWGLERFGWWVYALAVALIVSFIGYGVMQYKHLKARKNWKEYLLIERNYLAVDLALKLVCGVILITAFSK